MLRTLIFILFLVFLSESNADGFNMTKVDVEQWMIVNDTVMGGVSNSRLLSLPNEKYNRFEGNLSLRNNGGFASVRGLVKAYDSNNRTNQLCIKVRGDGKQYQLRLRNQRDFRGMAHVAKFYTDKDIWQIIKFSTSDFKPMFRGRFLKNVPKISLSNLEQIGFLVGDGQQGLFRLDFADSYWCENK